MQHLCIAALLLAVAAQSDSWMPWQDDKFPPAAGPKLDADSKRGDDEQSVTQGPEEGHGGSGRDWPEWKPGHPVWTDEMPPFFPNRPTGRPGNGNSRGPLQVSARGKRQAPGVKPGVSHPGHSRHHGRPLRGKFWPNRRNPGSVEFSPIFKVENVTFQNDTGVALKEGENTFVMPKFGGRGHHHHHTHGGRGSRHYMGGKRGPLENVQYVKLIYNATEPNKVSIEYGVLKQPDATSTKSSLLMKLSDIVGMDDNPEDY